MRNYELRHISELDYLFELKDELKQNGIRLSVLSRCDDINDLLKDKGLDYVTHRSIQEKLCEILDIVSLLRGDIV